ncbi:MAG TPA: efflux RND transporter periplasmic adaptor subunit [Pirellulales bacterium]
MRIAWRQTACVGLVSIFTACGCNHRAPAATASQPPLVTISQPLQRQVTDFRDFTGSTAAVQSVAVRARVSGYLVKIPFKEGSEVKQGDILFEIDPRPYQAQYDQAVGQLQEAQANTQLAKANVERAKALSRTPGVITRQDIDQYIAQLGVGEAQTVSGKAAEDAAELNVQFCTVRAPIDGRISRYEITIGNLVTQDQTLLTTIMSQDPMYGYFNVDENTMLNIQELIREGKMKSARTSNDIPVLMSLSNEPDFPHQGTVNFVDNRVDPTTGTLQVRGVFPNPMIRGSRVLTPGLFVRIRIFVGPPYQALLVNDRAIVRDQGLTLVYVVSSDDVVQYRNVVLGELHDGLRVITQGLEAGERLIVRGLQRVQPGMKVRSRLVDMPLPAKTTMQSDTGGAEPAAAMQPSTGTPGKEAGR